MPSIPRNTLPKFFKLCQDVKTELEFEEDIDFYLVSANEINACAYLSDGNSKPHIIEINAGLYNLMNDEEIKYVIGHEIGHLIHADGWIDTMVKAVYPDKKECPLYIKRRYDLYNLVAELSADRCGYMANKNLDACISAIYKLISGIDLKAEGVTVKSLIKDNEDRLSFLINEGMTEHTTHPHVPIRVKAIRLFAESPTDEQLNKDMVVLLDLLMSFGNSKTDVDMNAFMASAGLLMASADKKISNRERGYILEKLGEKLLTPVEFLEKVEKSDVPKIFETSVKRLLKADMGIEMLNYVIELALADDRIEESEIGFIFDFGAKIQMPKELVVRAIAANIRENFSPSAINLANVTTYEEEDEEQSEDPADSEPDRLSDNNQEEGEDEAQPVSFVMGLTEKFTARGRGLVICGVPAEGEVHCGNEIIITNGQKELLDVVAGVIYDGTIHDDYVFNDSRQEIGILLSKTSSRSISGDIYEWMAVVE